MARNSSLIVGFGLAAAVVIAAVVGYRLGSDASAAPAQSPGAPSQLAAENAVDSSAASEERAEPASRGAEADADAVDAGTAREPDPTPARHVAGERDRRPVASADARVERAPEGVGAGSPEMASTEGDGGPSVAEPAAPEIAPEPSWIDLTLPEGTELEIALREEVSSQSAVVGSVVEGELAEAVIADGRVALPRGALVRGKVTDAHALKKVGGQARLAIEFTQVEVEGHEIPIATAFSRIGKSETGKDAATIAAGAIVGTILGNQARKNDRGKLIGGLVGAGAGAAIAAKTEGETITLTAGTVLRLHLQQAVQISVPAR